MRPTFPPTTPAYDVTYAHRSIDEDYTSCPLTYTCVLSLLLAFPLFLWYARMRIGSGAAATPDGPAPKSMLANYTVLLTTVPPPTLAPQPPTPDGTMPQAPEVGWSPLNLSGGADEAPAGVPAARYEEADVRDALVDRDVGESIVCRRRYRILPDFGAGDRPYVVSAVRCRARPACHGFVVCRRYSSLSATVMIF